MSWSEWISKLFKKKPPANNKENSKSNAIKAPWMQFVLQEMGVKEVPGKGNNPRILEYHKATSLKASSDDVAWCAAFANWALLQAGVKGTNSAAALSFLKWGKKIDKPEYGCLVIFDHGGGHGHVSFYEHTREVDGYLALIGGNQQNMVKIGHYNPEAVAGYRMPL